MTNTLRVSHVLQFISRDFMQAKGNICHIARGCHVITSLSSAQKLI